MDTHSQPAPAASAGEAREHAYDVVVIGAGMGGLTAGALLARAGKRVLVVDEHERPGGYARALCHGAYTVDPAVHLIWSCDPAGPFGGGVIDAVMRHLGVRERCDFIRVDDPFYSVRFPDVALVVPTGREAFLAAHLRHFPGEARGLRRLVELCAQIYREALAFPIAPGLRDWLLTPRHFPALFRFRSATLQQALDQELADPRLMVLQK